MDIFIQDQEQLKKLTQDFAGFEKQVDETPRKVKYKSRVYTHLATYTLQLTSEKRRQLIIKTLILAVVTFGIAFTSTKFCDDWATMLSGKRVRALYVETQPVQPTKTQKSSQANLKLNVGSLPNDIQNLLVTKYLKPEETIPLFLTNQYYHKLAKLQNLFPLKTDEHEKNHYLKIRRNVDIQKIQEKAYVNAISNGNIGLAEWYEKQLRYPAKSWLAIRAFYAAAKSGNWTSLNYLHSKQFKWNTATCAAAAGAGQLDVLKWLHANGCPWNEDACNAAAGAGRLDVLKWLRENGCPWSSHTCANAAKEGHIDVLKWLREKGCPWDEVTTAAAAEGGHLNELQWLHEQGCPWNEHTCADAAKGGHLDVLKWLIENGCPFWQVSCASRASSGGHLGVLEWLNEHGYVWTANECRAAAEGNQLEVLQWLHAKKCPWDTWSCQNAASNGNLEMLQWLHANGCPWDFNTYQAATSHPHLLKWLAVAGCPGAEGFVKG